jgi:UPF0176 protein
MSVVIAALYEFTELLDPHAVRGPLQQVCDAAGVRGTLLLATEGVNGTIGGSPDGVERILAHLRAIDGFGDLQVKRSHAEEMPFKRMKVRVKQEIVTLGAGDVDPRASAGTYVDPADWNDLIAAEDVVVIDTRNDYEVAIGSFEGAVDPGTARFRDFPAWWAANAARFADKRVAMYCTGGIRCEKSTSWLRTQGVAEVFHLRGGILSYLEHVAPEESRWQGECFVFDDRVSVGHGLEPGPHGLCHACRRPVTAEQQRHPDYAEGISCHRCSAERTDADRQRYAERQRQVRLAEEAGRTHIGPPASPQ